MSESNCSACGAALIQGAGFCRRCGAPTISATSEQPTAILDQNTDTATTKRLDPRSTNPYGDATPFASPGFPGPQSAASERPARSRRLGIVLALVVVITILGFGPAIMRSLKTRSETPKSGPVSRTLIYPGSRIVLDLADSGGSVLQLQTSDPMEKVQTWYLSNLQPTKIMQVTSGTVILRKDNVIATVVSESNTTNIVIKQSGR